MNVARVETTVHVVSHLRQTICACRSRIGQSSATLRLNLLKLRPDSYLLLRVALEIAHGWNIFVDASDIYLRVEFHSRQNSQNVHRGGFTRASLLQLVSTLHDLRTRAQDISPAA